MCIYTYIYIYLHSCIHMYVCIYIYIYMHQENLSKNLFLVNFKSHYHIYTHNEIPNTLTYKERIKYLLVKSKTTPIHIQTHTMTKHQISIRCKAD